MYPYPALYHPRPAPPAPEPVAGAVKLRARQAGGSHISPDGATIYKPHYGGWLRADFDGRTAESWWVCEGLPEGAVELP